MDTGRTGWLAPDGSFIGCESWEHTSIAAEIAEKLGLYDEEDDTPADDILIENCWIRISILTFMDFGLSFGGLWGRFVTERQKEYLRGIYNDQHSVISNAGYNDLYQLGVIDKDELETALEKR